MGEHLLGATRIRAVVSAKHPTVRSGLMAFLASVEGVAIVGEACGCGELLPLVEWSLPDVAVLDCNDEHGGCLREIREIKQRSPGTRVVAVALDPAVEPAARAAGVDVFLVKGCPISQLAGAMRSAPDSDEKGARR